MKIVDCFTFYNELDMLKFRLEYLYDTVDYFVLVEATLTHAGHPKPLYFEHNKSMFSKYLDKIVHVIVTDLPKNPVLRLIKLNTTRLNWSREMKQRMHIHEGIERLKLEDNDRLIISDLDEIPNKDVLRGSYEFGAYALSQDLYYYTLNYKANQPWDLAKLIDYKTYKTFNSPQIIRSKLLDLPRIKNGGWHFSYFGNIDFIVNKIRNFCHEDWFRTLSYDDIKQKVLKGELMSGYQHCTLRYILVSDNTNLPEGIQLVFQRIEA